MAIDVSIWATEIYSAVVTCAHENREMIEPLTAIGALIVGAMVALVTGLLWLATRKLARSTEHLSAAAYEPAKEMSLARALTEKTFGLEEKQFLLAGRRSDLEGNQHRLRREQYLAEHRPAHKDQGRRITATCGRSFSGRKDNTWRSGGREYWRVRGNNKGGSLSVLLGQRRLARHSYGEKAAGVP
jgi:hypothetical protein